MFCNLLPSWQWPPMMGQPLTQATALMARRLMVVSFRWRAAPGGACCVLWLGLACGSIRQLRATAFLAHGLPQHVFLAC